MRTVNSHTGAAFEAGKLGHRNGAGPEGTEVVDGREEQELRNGRVPPQPGTQANLASMFGLPGLVGAPGRQKTAKKQKVATAVKGYGGKLLQTIPGDHAVEDPEWVLVLKNNAGNKQYHCLRCGHEWHGHDGRVIAHFLRLSGEGVKLCTRTPEERCRTVCERARKAKDAGKRSGGNDSALARTRDIAADGVMCSQEKKQADVDQALAEWAVLHGIPDAAIDSRCVPFRKVLDKLFLHGPTYTLPARQVLMCHEQRAENTRAGGLFLAHQEAAAHVEIMPYSGPALLDLLLLGLSSASARPQLALSSASARPQLAVFSSRCSLASTRSGAEPRRLAPRLCPTAPS